MSTAPISPTARAVVSAIPYSRPHRMFGSVTRKKVWNQEAPSVRAASSSSVPSSVSSGATSRITNGIEMKIVTSTIEGTAKRIWMPRALNHGSNQPPVPNSRTAARPTTTGETASGRSTIALTSRRPGNRSRARTIATTTPKTEVTTTVSAVMTPVRKKAWRTSGCDSRSVHPLSPGFSAATAIPTSGARISRPM